MDIACANNKIDFVSGFLALGVPPKSPELLHHVVRVAQLDTSARKMLKAPRKANSQTNSSTPPTVVSEAKQNITLFDVLHQAGYQFDQYDKEGNKLNIGSIFRSNKGNTPLFLATKLGKINEAKTILRFPSGLQSINYECNGHTGTHFSLKFPYTKLFNMLLCRGAVL